MQRERVSPAHKLAPRIVAFCGPHAVGKSTQTDAVADALTREGVAAWVWHHQGGGYGPVHAALQFALQRAELVAAWDDRATPDVVIADRWAVDTSILATVLAAQGRANEAAALRSIADAEARTLPPARYVLLDAPDAVLDARALARGRATTATEAAERAEVRRQAGLRGWPVVGEGDPAAVTRALVAIVRGWL